MGFLSEKGGLGPAQHQTFTVTSEIPASDIILRFHDCCGNYKVLSSFTFFMLKLDIWIQTIQLVDCKSICIFVVIYSLFPFYLPSTMIAGLL